MNVLSFYGFKDFDKLSEVDMAIYRFITNNSSKIPYMRVRDIANEAHVSNSSIMRFIHKLGYSSFPEFKVLFQSEQRQKTGEPTGMKFVTKENFPADIEDKIKVVAQKIFEADSVIFLGIGSSAMFAGYGTRQIAAHEINTFYVSDPFYPLAEQLKNSTNNVLITISNSGETPELIALLNNFVNDADATLVAITGDSNSTIARLSQYNLSYHVPIHKIGQFYDMTTKVPVLYIMESILENLAYLDGK